MHFFQEKTNKHDLKSSYDINLLIDKRSITYRGVFYKEHMNKSSRVGITNIYEFHLNKETSDFFLSYEIISTQNNHTWFKKNNFEKLQDIINYGFCSILNKWGLKHKNHISNFFNEIKNELKKEIDNEFLKNKKYDESLNHSLYKLIVDYYLYKKKIKFHDNVYEDIKYVFPKKKWLIKNNNKFIPAILDEYGIKTKRLIKELSKIDRDNIDIVSLISIAILFGKNYIDYLNKIDWVTLLNNNKIRKIYKYTCKDDIEKSVIINIINNLNGQGLYVIFDTFKIREFLEKNGFNLKIRSKTIEDLSLLLSEWTILKRRIDRGYVYKYNIPINVVKIIETPIEINNQIFYPKILLTTDDFYIEGIIMKNCMEKQFIHGSIYIYMSLSLNKKRINLQYHKGKLTTSYGKANTPVQKEIFGDAINILNERMIHYSDLKWGKIKDIFD